VIKYVIHTNLDIEKYDHCISSSANSRIYAFSWYLNSVTDVWDALVLNDYEAVMPLPRRKKYGFNYIYQAPWVQQLGVFSNLQIEKKLIEKFIAKIPKYFVLVDYLFNSENIFSSKYTTKRTNFLLKLNASFEEITKAYNGNRRRISKHNFTDYILNKNGDKTEFLNLYKNQGTNYQTTKNSLETLQNLLSANHRSIHIWNVYKKDELIAGLVWLKDKYRITYLLPVATSQAKKENIPTYIVNELIKEYQNTNYILDFEGSMVSGVASFYKSFGALKESYYWYKRRFIL